MSRDKRPRDINVWRARHIKSGKIHFIVGLYEGGRYYRPLTRPERRLNPAGSSWYGPFGYGGFYTKESAARRAAINFYGYSRIGDAFGNLTSAYEPI